MVDTTTVTRSLPVLADAAKIAQVIRNLISNAIKFTPCGGTVTIRLTMNEIENKVRVEVRDTGAGMTKEDRRKLFNEIVQFNPQALQNGQGSGLGLYLSRRIVDMHQGRVGVDLEWEGIGSVFFVEFPLVEQGCSDDVEMELCMSHTHTHTTHVLARKNFARRNLARENLARENLARENLARKIYTYILCQYTYIYMLYSMHLHYTYII